MLVDDSAMFSFFPEKMLQDSLWDSSNGFSGYVPRDFSSSDGISVRQSQLQGAGSWKLWCANRENLEKLRRICPKLWELQNGSGFFCAMKKTRLVF